MIAFPASQLLVYWQRIGPGLAGIGIGRSPEGAVVDLAAATRGETPQQRKRAARRAAQAAREMT